MFIITQVNETSDERITWNNHFEPSVLSDYIEVMRSSSVINLIITSWFCPIRILYGKLRMSNACTLFWNSRLGKKSIFPPILLTWEKSTICFHSWKHFSVNKVIHHVKKIFFFLKKKFGVPQGFANWTKMKKR